MIDSEKIKNRIRRYERAYYDELRMQMSRLTTVLDAFPDFLKGHRKIEAYLVQDGLVIIHWYDETDSFHFTVSALYAQNLIKELSDEILVFGGIPLSRPLNMLFSDMNVKMETTMGPVEWSTPWVTMEVTTELGISRWGEDSARDQARKDVLTFTSAYLMDMNNLTRQDTPKIFEKLEEIIKGFRLVLDSNPNEEVCQRYLTENPVLMYPSALSIIPKHRLGTEYITDFVIESSSTEYILVEIEPPSFKLFNNNGDPSARLMHAQKQVEDWRQWVQENLSYARNSLQGIMDPECWVIVGRQKELSDADIKALKRKNSELHHITIMTYDELLDRANRYVENLKKLG
ncbi:Shedu anti-phage system protein SduA domain-containing protein [Desulfosporosinus sp.]|uniref:Shedu anti-phage system protein SduA domain-containing protein n=1 Tax=Desulfosporosinus sp. TaxID=157907 RepID=UPI0025C382F3|nr:Shedu anti-phage system protein SduA domain-containing protein [Desulfosporosinus sp.]MBC2728637.1 DUF4263 domain-containing protein [Desulfosporosinus sp.]